MHANRTMTTLTAQEIAEVAREVIGDIADEHPWDPEDEAWQWQMMVEWLADSVWNESVHWHIRMIQMIREKDTTALMRMVLELKRGR